MLIPQHFPVDHTRCYFCAKMLPVDKKYCHFSHSCTSFLCAEHAGTQIKEQFVFDESSLLKNTEKENYPIDHKSSLRGRISPAMTFVRTSYKADFLNKKAFLEKNFKCLIMKSSVFQLYKCMLPLMVLQVSDGI